MPKKCTICGSDAIFQIKGTSDFYCDDCAKDNFSDIDLLEKVERQAEKLKSLVEEKLE
ncbi:MAG: hypothetical protein ABIF10_01060 [Candidatus Woesearchaeota archaeon]